MGLSTGKVTFCTHWVIFRFSNNYGQLNQEELNAMNLVLKIPYNWIVWVYILKNHKNRHFFLCILMWNKSFLNCHDSSERLFLAKTSDRSTGGNAWTLRQKEFLFTISLTIYYLWDTYFVSSRYFSILLCIRQDSLHWDTRLTKQH